MGTKNNPGEFDCYANAKPDEPMFILLGRDPSAGALVRLWALIRHGQIEQGLRPPKDAAKVAEALKSAEAMDTACREAGRTPISPELLLIQASEALSEHPEGYEHPCHCALCRSYA